MTHFAVPDPCLDFICLNGGTCIDEQTPEEVNERNIVPYMLNFFCRCLPGFTGHRCESKYFLLALANRNNENDSLIHHDFHVAFASQY